MDFNPQQQHILLSKMGYTGPANPKMMDAFLSSNPGAAARMGKFSRAAQKMNAGTVGMAQGGTANKAPLPTAFTVKTSGGKMDERTYTVVDSAGKVVFGPTPNKGAADADAKSRNAAASTPAPTTTTPATGTPGTSTNPAPGGHPSWITPPPPGVGVTQALVEHTNPITGEKWTAPTGGYTVNVSAPAPTTPPNTGTPTNPAPNTSSDFDEKGLLKSGATVILVEENGKFYLKDSQGRFLSNQTITGGSGNRYVFADAAAAQKYMDTKGFKNSATPTTPPVSPTNPAPTTPPATGDGITTVPALSPGRGLIQDTIRDPFTYVSTPTVSTTSPTTDSTTIAEGTGQVTGDVSATTTGVDTTAQVVAPTAITPEAVTAVTSADAVAASTAGIKPAQGAIKEGSTIAAQQQTQTSIADVEAAQGTGILMSNPVQRQIEAGEMVSGTAVDAAKVDKMMSQVQAAEATPTDKATVQGQLSELMTQFEGGKTPAWAAGAMRSAQAMLAERGLGASSMAGQAVIQAAMEAALPIAQIDAQTRAQFESQNLSNRQQTAMFAAQQRASFLQQDFDQNFQTRVLNAAKVSDIANLNFTAAQTIALENSRIINTVNLANLNNRQAMVLAKASALANLDIANLNNRQQAAVQNAQNFLQVDLTNLDNAQQAEMFRAQSNVQAILTDTAAENATIQFNAASKNQADQFFADLTARALQFNADQQNAMNQFNTGEANATARFNAQQKAARDQFNATNSLVIAQANAKWRQDVATEATRAQNEANLQAAAAANAMTARAMEETWQQEKDVIAYAFTAIENDKDRALQVTLADKEIDLAKWTAAEAESAARTEALVNLVFGGFGS
jgi:hypothetical protein